MIIEENYLHLKKQQLILGKKELESSETQTVKNGCKMQTFVLILGNS